MKKPAVMLFVWRDATSIDEWQNIEDAAKEVPSTIQTVGWLIGESKTAYSVSLNHDTSARNVSQTIVIPKAWVVSKRRLKLGR